MPTKKSPKSAPKKVKTLPSVTSESSNIRAYVGYITIIGWFIAYFAIKSEDKEYELFHLKQSLGLHLSMLVCEVLSCILFFLLPFLWIIYIVALVVFALKAKEGKKELVPYLGEKFQEWFSFL
ncbi:MAG: hypothetical protein WCK88_06880 [bacterium]